MRVAVALSGGADSVALLRALAARRQEMGLVLHAAHLHHGLRGAEADGDLEFCRALAAKLDVPFHEARVDTAQEARADAKIGKAGREHRGSGAAAALLVVPRTHVQTGQWFSMQWRRRIHSTIRRKRFWASFCVALGRRVWLESVED